MCLSLLLSFRFLSPHNVFLPIIAISPSFCWSGEEQKLSHNLYSNPARTGGLMGLYLGAANIVLFTVPRFFCIVSLAYFIPEYSVQIPYVNITALTDASIQELRFRRGVFPWSLSEKMVMEDNNLQMIYLYAASKFELTNKYALLLDKLQKMTM